MPIHDVGYRRWVGNVSSVWLRWTVVAGAGIRLVWKSHWLRRMLIFAWLPTAVTGVGFFIYEQSLERSEMKGLVGPVITQILGEGYRVPDRHGSRVSGSGVNSGAGAATRQGTAREPNADDPPSATLLDTYKKDPKEVRHVIWSMLLMAFFRYPQGLLMVLIVGMIAPSLISLDMRSRAYLLYFSAHHAAGIHLWQGVGDLDIPGRCDHFACAVLYFLGVLLSPSLEVVLYTWDLPFRIILASLVLMLPTTSLALFFSSLTSESRYAGFAWFALWGLGWAAYANLSAFAQSRQWSMLSLYHMLGRVQEWVFGLSTNTNDVSSAAFLLIVVTVMPFIVLTTRVIAPMRV